MVRPSWDGNLGSIYVGLWILKLLPLKKHLLSESTALMTSVRVGQPSREGTQWCPLVEKMSKEQESILWRLYETDDRNGLN